MSQENFLYLFIAMGIGWAIVWLYIVRSVPKSAPEAGIDQKVGKLRHRLIFPIGAILLVLLAVSIYWAPYPQARARSIGEPTLTVNVDSLQWAWILSKQELPANTVIQFDVTSKDVNHGFAIYNPDGKLVTQTQAMPGYTNKLIWRFDEPGEYTVRCLEFCGLGHDIMLTKFTVV